ncbi:MAG: hypothetical protein GY865_09885, partial [candidate division Zixibacteria bacterium]|nr:hypothetical protein [candidate division Zixibacteria bacterium]
MRRLFFCSGLLLVYLIFSLILGCSGSKDSVGPDIETSEPVDLSNPHDLGGNPIDSIAVDTVIIDTITGDTIVWDTIGWDTLSWDTIGWDTLPWDTIGWDTLP